MGTTIFLLSSAAILLSASDLWAVQARAVGSVLDVVGVRNEVVVPAEIDGSPPLIGSGSRDRHQAEAHGPFLLLDLPAPTAPRPAAAAASLALLVAAVAVSVRTPISTVIKGGVVAVGVIVAATICYAAWWSPRAPLDVATLVVDWRTSALGPAIAVAFVFAAELYPVAGGFVLKSVWLWLALVATGLFSVLRLAFVAAGYDAFGHVAFLPLFHLGGVFWDILPGVAVLVLAHAALATSSPLGARRWWRR